jgi:hypothetical protein
MAWLLHMVPAAATSATTAERLLCIPDVPLQLAKQLVAAGMRISFLQMTEAASSMVAGAEVWMQAQLQQRVGVYIPAAAIKLCATRDWVSLLAMCQGHGQDNKFPLETVSALAAQPSCAVG